MPVNAARFHYSHANNKRYRRKVFVSLDKCRRSGVVSFFDFSVVINAVHVLVVVVVVVSFIRP